MTDGSGIDHREYNKSNEEADRLGKEAQSMCRLLFLEESMKELELKYGCNPNQKPAKVFMEEGELPFTVLMVNLVISTYQMLLIAGSQ